jgi:hypothetical protein
VMKIFSSCDISELGNDNVQKLKKNIFRFSIVRKRFMQSVITFPAHEPGVDPTGDNQYRAMGW